MIFERTTYKELEAIVVLHLGSMARGPSRTTTKMLAKGTSPMNRRQHSTAERGKLLSMSISRTIQKNNSPTVNKKAEPMRCGSAFFMTTLRCFTQHRIMPYADIICYQQTSPHDDGGRGALPRASSCDSMPSAHRRLLLAASVPAASAQEQCPQLSC